MTMNALETFIFEHFRFEDSIRVRPRDHIYLVHGTYPVLFTELHGDGEVMCFFYDPCSDDATVRSEMLKGVTAVARDGAGIYEWQCNRIGCDHRRHPLERAYLERVKLWANTNLQSAILGR
jgi:hypothetical protein